MTSASKTPKSGYTPREIRALIAIREEKLEEIAASLQEDAKRISETIDRKRSNERIREKLCDYWNLPYEKLWGPKANGSEVQAA